MVYQGLCVVEGALKFDGSGTLSVIVIDLFVFPVIVYSLK